MTGYDGATPLADAERLLQEFLGLRPSLSIVELEGRVRSLLGASRSQLAFFLLMLTDPQVTLNVLPEIVVAALRPRDALMVREIIGRLSRQTLRESLAPLLRDRFKIADDEELRRAAELLEHLGLQVELRELVDAALSSTDPDVTEVGRDFAQQQKS